ncbi:MAG: hypothetical protein Q9227_007099 [Pyrenula ochraceoflavens]
MPRPPKPVPQELPSSTFVIDNGANSLKAGFAASVGASHSEALSQCEVVPNAIVRTRNKRIYVGAQVDNVENWNEAIFRRPVERGQLVNWEAEKEIWDQSFFQPETARSDLLIKDPGDTTLILTEAPNSIAALQKNEDEVVMEEWGFGGYARRIGSSLNAYNDLHPLFGNTIVKPPNPQCPLPVECLLLIDSGYSSTTVTPLYNSNPLNRAVRRIDFGGKHLTNLLKDIISMRHLDLRQDVKIVNDVKEEVCFVSSDFKRDMEWTWKGNRKKILRAAKKGLESNPNSDAKDGYSDVNPPDPTIVVDYVLPDYFTIKKGFSRPHDPLAAVQKRKRGASPSLSSSEVFMTLGNERFTVPEIIFNPSFIGSKQAGLCETVMQSLSVLPPAFQASMLANILVVGGNAKIPGFVERVEAGVRELASAECVVRVRKMQDPVTSTWLGGVRMSWNREAMKEVAVTRQEYQENGSLWVGRKFAGLEGR